MLFSLPQEFIASLSFLFLFFFLLTFLVEETGTWCRRPRLCAAVGTRCCRRLRRRQTLRSCQPSPPEKRRERGGAFTRRRARHPSLPPPLPTDCKLRTRSVSSRASVTRRTPSSSADSLPRTRRYVALLSLLILYQRFHNLIMASIADVGETGLYFPSLLIS